MGLSYINGNLITMAKNNQVAAFVHGCNCWSRMGAGFALQVKNEFPEAYYVDFITRAGDLKKLGGFSKTNAYGFCIYNLYTQYYYGRSTSHFDPQAFKSGLSLVILDCIDNNVYTLHMPKIGSDLGGGEWFEIEKIIIDVLSKHNDFNIVVVNYEKVL